MSGGMRERVSVCWSELMVEWLGERGSGGVRE